MAKSRKSTRTSLSGGNRELLTWALHGLEQEIASTRQRLQELEARARQLRTSARGTGAQATAEGATSASPAAKPARKRRKLSADARRRMCLTEAGLRRRDAIVLGRCLVERVPVAVSMAGGYAPDVDAIARIHAGTIAEAAQCARRWGRATPWRPSPSPTDASAPRRSAGVHRH